MRRYISRSGQRLLKYLIFAAVIFIFLPLLFQKLNDDGSSFDLEPKSRRRGNDFLPDDGNDDAGDRIVKNKDEKKDDDHRGGGGTAAVEDSESGRKKQQFESKKKRRREDMADIPDIPGLHNAGVLMKNANRQSKDPSRMAKIDWHDYERMKSDSKRSGPGEQGMPFHVAKDADVTKRKDALYRVNGFNALASDHIALNRSLKDLRPKECKKKQYLEYLPTVSVILPFHNEHLSTLLRSVHSIVDRSPPELLKEVILADDFSTKDFLKDELEKYVLDNFPKGKVKVLRAQKREGLIRARLMGAKAATGEVILFLDSHSECYHNWLPPLLEPIAYDYRTVVCPFVDVVDYETFEYRLQDNGARGAFDWELYYKRLPLLPEDLKHPAEPFKSPVMAGGYFAINTKWFWELGGYDEGLDIWGGEQYELSFKIWQCGGQMVDTACSHVGHIYRKFAPFPNPGVGDFVGRNYMRVADVWMDEYKEYIYMRRPHYRKLDLGDLTKQREVRTRLKCKPFKWFMEEIAFDLPKKYPPVDPPDGAKGEIRSAADTGLCVDTRFKGQNERFELERCIKENPSGAGGEQNFLYTWHRDIRPGKRTMCFDVSSSQDQAPLVLFACHGQKGNQEWRYRYSSLQLYHPVSGLCLDCDIGRRELFMRKCDDSSKTQQWNFEHINKTVIDQFH